MQNNECNKQRLRARARLRNFDTLLFQRFLKMGASTVDCTRRKARETLLQGIRVVRQNEIVSSHEVKSPANLSRPVVVAAQWVNQHEIMARIRSSAGRHPYLILGTSLTYPSVQPASHRQWSGRFGLP